MNLSFRHYFPLHFVDLLGLIFLGCLFTFIPEVSFGKMVAIEEIGFEGWVPNISVPTRVRIRVARPHSAPQSIELSIKITRDKPMPQHKLLLTTRVNLEAKEERVLDIPLIITPGDGIEVTAIDPSGAVLGKDTARVQQQAGNLVALICLKETICQQAQSRISFVGTDEDRVQKRKELNFVVVRDPPNAWWEYSAATVVVIASPISYLTSQQQEAIEFFTRDGGWLVIAEDLVDNQSFLAQYRTGLPYGRLLVVGNGRLLRIQGLEDDMLNSLFAGEGLRRMLQFPRHSDPVYQTSDLAWARKRLATNFDFPKLNWVIAWLSAYILIVGLVNFTLLGWLGRREWGWVTVPALAAIFAVSLYWANASRRPSSLLLDQIGIYRMDDRSPVASLDIALRITSPSRTPLEISTGREAILTGPDYFDFRVFPSLNPGGLLDFRWKVRLDERQRFDLHLLKWSFFDIELEDFYRLPGTVWIDGDGLLRNDTGQDFSQALFIDPEKVYFLDSLSHGAVVDLSRVRNEPLQAYIRKDGTSLSQEDAKKPFNLVEWIWRLTNNTHDLFHDRSGLFLGLAEGEDLDVKIPVPPLGRREYMLVVTSMGAKP